MVLKSEFYIYPPNVGWIQNKSQLIDWESTIFTVLTYFSVNGGKLKFCLAVGSLKYINAQENSFEFETLE